MLTPATFLPSASTLLDGIAVDYLTDADRARRLLKPMLAADQVALDIETAPNPMEVDRLETLLLERSTAIGQIKALRKLKVPAVEIAKRIAEKDRLDAHIKYVERAGLDPRRARIRLLQVYDGGDRVLVVDLDRTGAGLLDLFDDAHVVVVHNAAFEMAFFEAAKVGLGVVHDTAQACRLTLGEHATGLASGAEAYLGISLDKALQVSDWNAPRLTQEQIRYAGLDAVITWKLAERVFAALGNQAPAYDLQLPAAAAAMRMQYRGFRFDTAAHDQLIADLQRERFDVELEYYAACVDAGHPSLADKVPSTPAQKIAVLEALLSSDELNQWARTASSGALSTRRSEFNRARHCPPIAALAKLSRIDKLLSSFGQSLGALVSRQTGRIHASYHVASTSSGRASCSRPNLQQVPQDKRFRALFVAEPGHVLICADYASMELRAAAHIFGDANMTAAFENSLDLHTITASRMTGEPPENITPEQRKGAKAVNFGSIYGQGPRGLQAAAWEKFELVLTQAEATAWVRAFHNSYRDLVHNQQAHHLRCQASQRIVIGKDAHKGIGRIFPFSRLKQGDNGYTRTRNLPIQGACADASMLALAYVDERLFNARIEGGPVAWLHDEIVLEVRAEQADKAALILKQSMIDGFAETFPGAPLKGLVDLHVASNWAAAKEKPKPTSPSLPPSSTSQSQETAS